jgi:hypothetical protein
MMRVNLRGDRGAGPDVGAGRRCPRGPWRSSPNAAVPPTPIVRRMERRIDLSNLDLDRAAVLIAERVPGWSAWGLTVHPPTWMDNEAEWPQPLLLDRSEIQRPRSVGLLVEGRGDLVFAQFVLYAGGWADADHSPDGEDIVCEYVELDDVEEFGPVLDRVVVRLRPRDGAPRRLPGERE